MLVDTSVWIDFFNRTETKQRNYLVAEIAKGGDIILCGVVLTEILMGIKSDEKASDVAEVLSAFPVCPDLDRPGYAKAAALYRRCRSNGYTIRSTIDCVIAQICIRDGLSLLTRDRDFEVIAEHSDLAVLGDLTFKFGIQPFPKQGGVVVDNEMVNKIRDDAGI